MKRLSYPFTASQIRDARLGEIVSLSGKVFTGRDRLHQFLAEGGRPPLDLRDGAMFHCGPVTAREGGAWAIRAAGPTTSSRQEPYMPSIIERLQIRVIIGKGGMGDGTRRACVKHGCIYVQAIGGAAVLLAGSIQSVVGVHFLREFGEAEALWELAVEDLRGIVTIDTRGRCLHENIRTVSRKALDRML
ncbi:MAG: FumA C-terminus/TtdB family hydratase beta subunit [Verrucomicrobiota bacterium]|nr:FumA C-terminus/TtdB family hydratase beta subunit [Verrucomicrobiota bacterium]